MHVIQCLCYKMKSLHEYIYSKFNQLLLPSRTTYNRYADDRGMIRAAMMSRKKKMARYLTQEAIRRGTMDNCSVVVIFFR
jgi:hypothetical protein